MIKTLYDHKILINILLSYILILTLPLVLGIYIYQRTISIVDQDAVRFNQLVLDRSRDTIDQHLRASRTHIYQIAMDSNVRELLRDSGPMQPVTPWLIYRTWRSVQMSNAYKDDFVLATYVYFNGLDIVITPETAYTNTKNFYSSFLSIDTLSYESWRDTYINPYHIHHLETAVGARIAGQPYQVIPYLHSLPLDAPINSGKVILFLDVNKVNALFSDVAEMDGFMYITDAKGRVITSLGRNVDLAIEQLAEQPFSSPSLRINVDGQEMMVSHIRSQDTRWSYVAAIPLSKALHSVYYIRQITIVVSILIILLGFLIITVIAYHNYQPIRNILQAITQRREKQDNRNYGTYRYIQESVISIVGENRDLAQILEKQKPLLVDSIINKIIKGDFATEEEIKRAMNSIQMTFAGLCYTVIVIRFIPHERESEDTDLRQFIYSKAIARKYIEQCAGNVLVYEKDSNTMVILLADQAHAVSREDAASSVTGAICTVLDEHLTGDYDYTLAVGRSCHSLLDINQSYKEALIMIGFTQAHDHDKVMYYHAIDESSFTYYYPLNVEKKLVTSIKDANLDELDAAIQSICTENFIKRSISPLMVQQLFADMRSTLIKLLVDIQADISSTRYAGDLEILFMANEEAAFFQYYKIISRQIAGEFENKRNNRNHVLLNQMINCIDQCYTDPTFSLTKLSELFNLTSVYISRFFKEQTGENFFSYLEKKRMATAASLLAERKTSISQIAEKTGYSNAHVFSRAFKRYYSVSPSDYRDQQKNSEVKSSHLAV